MPENNCQEAWHKIVWRNVKAELHGSTTCCLENSIPKMTMLDGVRMPDHISFEMHSVSTLILQKAQKIALDADNTIFSDTAGEIAPAPHMPGRQAG